MRHLAVALGVIAAVALTACADEARHENANLVQGIKGYDEVDVRPGMFLRKTTGEDGVSAYEGSGFVAAGQSGQTDEIGVARGVFHMNGDGHNKLGPFGPNYRGMMAAALYFPSSIVNGSTADGNELLPGNNVDVIRWDNFAEHPQSCEGEEGDQDRSGIDIFNTGHNRLHGRLYHGRVYCYRRGTSEEERRGAAASITTDFGIPLDKWFFILVEQQMAAPSDVFDGDANNLCCALDLVPYGRTSTNRVWLHEDPATAYTLLRAARNVQNISENDRKIDRIRFGIVTNRPDIQGGQPFKFFYDWAWIATSLAAKPAVWYR